MKGVFLAHHADDQAETVLKRIFEGATFAKLRGLTPKKQIGEITLYRPLLKVRKDEIISWLKKENIHFFEDATNHDPQFLRARLRHVLLPTLTEYFGKQITPTLCRMGESAAELSSFLEQLISPYLSRIQSINDTIQLDLGAHPPSHPYLLKMVIRSFFNLQKISLSQATVDTIIAHMEKGSRHKSLNIGGREVILHCKRIILGTYPKSTRG